MAPPSGGPRPGRLLALCFVLIGVLYAIMFGTGNTTPQLGLDLRGGTQVTLTPRVEAGSGQLSDANLDKAVDIIRQRVNGIGVAEADVATEGNNIVISVPGKGREEVVNLVGQTAQLRFRHVLAAGASTPALEPEPTPSATGKAGGKKGGNRNNSGGGGGQNNNQDEVGSGDNNNRVLPPGLSAAATPSPSPAATGEGVAATPAPSATPSAAASPGLGAERELPETKTKEDAMAFYEDADCSAGQQLVVDNPEWPMVACDADGSGKYLLDVAAVQGTEISGADAGIPQGSIGGDWQVNLSFKSNGSRQFAEVTRKAASLPEIGQCTPDQGCNAVAIVLDGVVQSAPRIDDPQGITGGEAQITGDFSEREARDLANVLKYGALPITFDQEQAVTVSATLGNDQLNAGLIAGGIGVVLVIIYSFLAYRGLGLVTVASLLIAGLMTYAAVVLLGDTISFTLTLAGIAGVIVAIGITADSFVIYFERLRDEVRDGRTLRAAAERGWDRAIKTILAADFISLLGAVVLYLLSIGSVRGFAFTLGLSTAIDLVVVYLFTHPLVSVLVRTKAFGSGRSWTGLSPEQLGAAPKADAPATASRRPHRAREA